MIILLSIVGSLVGYLLIGFILSGLFNKFLTLYTTRKADPPFWIICTALWPVLTAVALIVLPFYLICLTNLPQRFINWSNNKSDSDRKEISA